jgi:hypothetical protein
MSDIFEANQDAFNPKRREKATIKTYDTQKRGPCLWVWGRPLHDEEVTQPHTTKYTDRRSTGDGQPEVAPPNEIQNPACAEQSDLSNAVASQRSGSIVS